MNIYNERKLILYVAMSLDGYIADPQGRIDFLNDFSLSDTGYDAFYDTVDTLIMGSTTYRQIRDELSPGAWPYKGKQCYLYTRQSHIYSGDSHVIPVDIPPERLLREIRRQPGKNIWLAGGGRLVNTFLMENLIDIYMIYVIPVLLGDGLPLFPRGFPKTNLNLKSCIPLGQMAELIYEGHSI